MKKQILLSFLCAGTLFLMTGCTPTQSDTAAPETPAAPAENVPAESTSAESAPAENAPVVEKAAGVGVTHKADWEDSSEKPMSIVTVPLATYFKAQDMAVFNMQIPSAMNLYQAEIGEFPKSEEEFMTQIIQKNQIILPQLPEGDSYFYDVPSHTLMVRTQQAAP